MSLKRKITTELIKWKENPDKMPLLLYGARQVGKTFILKNFGENNYEDYVYFNIEALKEASDIFERDLNPTRIIRELSALSNKTIKKRETLIILDEVQVNNKVLTSLKYFNEEEPEYHIIAAGSLLGVALKREQFSFPVGKVNMLNMYPLDFEEFLWATGNKELSDIIIEHFLNFSEMALHESALELYRKYLIVGGMPKVVSRYLEDPQLTNHEAVLTEQRFIDNSYIADMAKYASERETLKIISAWNSIPGQFAKPNHKFQYKVIASGARAHEYEVPIQWLESAGIVNRCVKVTQGKLPLTAYSDSSAFKIYTGDTGLLCCKFGIPANILLFGRSDMNDFKGALIENYVMQALKSNGINPYYWDSNGRAEVDFVYQSKDGNIIPAEAKSSVNVRAKSLNRFVDLYKPAYSIRISEKNFGFENNIKSIPLYAVFCIDA